MPETDQPALVLGFLLIGALIMGVFIGGLIIGVLIGAIVKLGKVAIFAALLVSQHYCWFIGTALTIFAAVQVYRALANCFTDTEEDTSRRTTKILSYNVLQTDLKLQERMKALGDLIQLHSPDVICFQEVTSDAYLIFVQSNWWKSYRCPALDERQPSFCMQLSKLPVNSFSFVPFKNSTTGRKICTAEIEVGGVQGKPLVVATTHLQGPVPHCGGMFSKERVAQAKEALELLENSRNLIFCGDLNWDEELDGKFPLFGGWVDAWSELRPSENGWTFDTESNQMLSGNHPLQKRLDRFICNLRDFRLKKIDMIGTAILGLSYHYGLLLEVERQ